MFYNPDKIERKNISENKYTRLNADEILKCWKIRKIEAITPHNVRATLERINQSIKKVLSFYDFNVDHRNDFGILNCSIFKKNLSLIGRLQLSRHSSILKFFNKDGKDIVFTEHHNGEYGAIFIHTDKLKQFVEIINNALEKIEKEELEKGESKEKEEKSEKEIFGRTNYTLTSTLSSEKISSIEQEEKLNAQSYRKYAGCFDKFMSNNYTDHDLHGDYYTNANQKDQFTKYLFTYAPSILDKFSQKYSKLHIGINNAKTLLLDGKNIAYSDVIFQRLFLFQIKQVVSENSPLVGDYLFTQGERNQLFSFSSIKDCADEQDLIKACSNAKKIIENASKRYHLYKNNKALIVGNHHNKKFEISVYIANNSYLQFRAKINSLAENKKLQKIDALVNKRKQLLQYHSSNKHLLLIGAHGKDNRIIYRAGFNDHIFLHVSNDPDCIFSPTALLHNWLKNNKNTNNKLHKDIKELCDLGEQAYKDAIVMCNQLKAVGYLDESQADDKNDYNDVLDLAKDYFNIMGINACDESFGANKATDQDYRGGRHSNICNNLITQTRNSNELNHNNIHINNNSEQQLYATFIKAHKQHTNFFTGNLCSFWRTNDDSENQIEKGEFIKELTDLINGCHSTRRGCFFGMKNSGKTSLKALKSLGLKEKEQQYTEEDVQSILINPVCQLK